jgi:hypothetical protein
MPTIDPESIPKDRAMLIKELFAGDVTRDIPPVVYFHEQNPTSLANEVSEYIVTGGYPAGDPRQRRVPRGIHEEYVRLLETIVKELGKPGGPELPNCWISGFYGSGKSSFAKLLGLALDGAAIPDGRSLSEAWLARNTSPRAAEMKTAWRGLRERIDPISVVFDVGSVARDGEHLHAAALRKVQHRLGYCPTNSHVADYELTLERDKLWQQFEDVAAEALGVPWAEARKEHRAADRFSLVMHRMFPDEYPEPMSWFDSRAGSHTRNASPEDVVAAIRDMLGFRKPGATLFLVIDEVSQYVLSSHDRYDRLRAFATALGATLRGKAWLLALGQQQLDEQSDEAFVIWVRDRFPSQLRVHLDTTNIRDVVHKRLLQKAPAASRLLADLFEKHRADLKLYAYGCDAVTSEEFGEIYPMLPGQIELILQITTALRTRSSRSQGDDHAIRGLLQLLGELFRDQKLAEKPVGALVTLDSVYEVQHTALDSDVQNSMARILAQCTADEDALLVRAAKAVALLELIQDSTPTDAKLVAQCLYDRVDLGNNVADVTAALEELRRRNLVTYSQKEGYKIQSSAGEDWERERRDIGAPRETISDLVQEALKVQLAEPDRPRHQGRPFPLEGMFSDGRKADDVTLVDARDDACVVIDYRFLPKDDRSEATWIRRSNEAALQNRLVWVCGDTEQLEHVARELTRSRKMVQTYEPRMESLQVARRLLVTQEKARGEELERDFRAAVNSAWMAGRMYFRGRAIVPGEHGAAPSTAIQSATTRLLPDLYPHFVATQITPAEVLQLVASELVGPSPKFLAPDLGILDVDSGRYVATCTGVVPTRVNDHISAEGGVSGTALLAHFGRPPYGYTANVVKACVAGLLRDSRIRVQPEGGVEISGYRDAGVRDFFEKDQVFRRSNIFPADDDDITVPTRNRICQFFETRLNHPMPNRDNTDIADAVMITFMPLAEQLRSVFARLNQLPGSPRGPEILEKLAEALEKCIRSGRQTNPAVKLVKRHLDTLQEGVPRVQIFDAELTPEAIASVREARETVDRQAAQLADAGVTATNVEVAARRITDHLATDHPWRDVATLTDDLDAIRTAYTAERKRLLETQEQETENARRAVKRRDGFATLTAEQAHDVLRPFTSVVADTTPEAVAPTLVALREAFDIRLRRAQADANTTLDGILSSGPRPMIRAHDLRLSNREVATEADIDALLAEIREQLLMQIKAGSRVRIV